MNPRSKPAADRSGNVYPSSFNGYDADLARLADDGNPHGCDEVYGVAEPARRMPQLAAVLGALRGVDFSEVAVMTLIAAPVAVIGTICYVYFT